MLKNQAIDDLEDFKDSIETQRIYQGKVVNHLKKPKPTLKASAAFVVPQDHQVWVKTWGCGHNNSDGEYMAGLLATHGYKVVLEDTLKQDCDVWLLNSCTVKGPSEQTFVNEIQKAQLDGKSVIVSGCVPQAAPQNQKWNKLSIIGVQQIDRVVEVVEETIKGNTVQLLKERKESNKKIGGAKLDMPKIRRNPLIEIIPINTGCLNQCTYCKTKHARGDLGSYQPEEIIQRVEQVIQEGVVEIWLTSEDLGAYGHDIGVSIVELLWGIIEAMDRLDPSNVCMLRIGMTNPPYILEHIYDMAVILSHPRVYSFLHIPVQAASDKVLHDMRRLYTKADFKRVVDVLLEHVENVTIATDVICGFPTETKEDFDETLKLIKEYKFSVLHISQFYPRPGTPAAKLSLLPTQEVKRRSKELTTLFESYSNNQDEVGKKLEILVTDQASDGEHYIGHDKYYRQILVEMDPNIMGKKVLVEVVQVSKFHLKAVVDESVPFRSLQNLVAIQQPKFVRVRRKMVRVKEESTFNSGLFWCFVWLIVGASKIQLTTTWKILLICPIAVLLAELQRIKPISFYMAISVLLSFTLL